MGGQHLALCAVTLCHGVLSFEPCHRENVVSDGMETCTGILQDSYLLVLRRMLKEAKSWQESEAVLYAAR